MIVLSNIWAAPGVSRVPSSHKIAAALGRRGGWLISNHHHHHQQQQAFVRRKQKPLHLTKCCSAVDDYQVLSAINTSYNDILILETADSRMLLLDSTRIYIYIYIYMHSLLNLITISFCPILFLFLFLPTNTYHPPAAADNIHSIFIKGQAWTGSYWDEFAGLPTIIPEGPIAIFGLGGGTAAHLMLDLWPSLQLHGWEIDEILIDKAREHLGLSDLEKHTEGGGVLNVHIGDALSASSSISGGYAGIVIDLFSGGEVLAQLQEVETWLELHDKLMPNGRLMVNCGGVTCSDGTWEKNATLKTLCQAFPGQVNWKKMPKSEGENYLALTGPLPDLTLWAAALPDRLGSSVVQWACCFP